MDYEKKYKEALERAEEAVQKGCLDKDMFDIIFPSKESEDERIRKLLVWQVYRNIEDETNDLAGSIYDGIKGHDPDLEESIEDWKKCLAWLEKQKELKPAEWSEEDKAMIKSILFVLESYVSKSECASSPSLITTYPTYYKEIDWLKSLRPLPHWKPSEELIVCLERLIAFKNPEPEDIKGCEELLEQLKKL